jgi:hypothetical protein
MRYIEIPGALTKQEQEERDDAEQMIIDYLGDVFTLLEIHSDHQGSLELAKQIARKVIADFLIEEERNFQDLSHFNGCRAVTSQRLAGVGYAKREA